LPRFPRVSKTIARSERNGATGLRNEKAPGSLPALSFLQLTSPRAQGEVFSHSSS
jgi:hypothetical protein